MSNTNRVDKELFREEHYLGKPADDNDKIISRRIDILETFEGFFNKELNLVEAGCGGGATINRISHKFAYALGIDLFDYSEAFLQSKNILEANNSEFLQIDLEKEIPEKKIRQVDQF